MQAGELIKLGHYNRNDIISPYVFTRDGKLWFYVNLPQGNPKEDFKAIKQAVFWNLSGMSLSPIATNNILTGKILEKKLKAGTIPKAFTRGYFVETTQSKTVTSNFLATLGKKKGSEIKWGGFTIMMPMVNLIDDVLEDL